MAISYKKLWKLLIDRDMKKKDLMAISGISQSSVTKMGRNENVNTEVLVRVCLALNCDIGDVAEIILPESEQEQGMIIWTRNNLLLQWTTLQQH